MQDIASREDTAEVTVEPDLERVRRRLGVANTAGALTTRAWGSTLWNPIPLRPSASARYTGWFTRIEDGMTRILIADDHRLTVDGTVKLLWEEWPDLLTAFTVPDAIRQVDLHQPDLVLLDIWFPGRGYSGFFVLEHCQRKALPTRILITSAWDDPETVGWARKRKAHGFIGKHRSSLRLIEAIRVLLAGGEAWPPPPEPDQEPPPLLRVGHRRVLQCVAAGMTYAETATRLDLAEVTVDKYLQEARRRLGARNTAHAVAIAERRGLFLVDPLPADFCPPPPRR